MLKLLKKPIGLNIRYKVKFYLGQCVNLLILIALFVKRDNIYLVVCFVEVFQVTCLSQTLQDHCQSFRRTTVIS